MADSYTLPATQSLMECDLKAGHKLIALVIGSLCRYGECRVSNTHLQMVSRYSDAGVKRALIELADDGLITRTGIRNSRRFHMTAKGWALLGFGGGNRGEDTVAPVLPPPAPTPANDPKPEKKERKKAEKRSLTIEEHCALELPDFIPPAAWRAFIEYRHHDKGPFSERAAKGIIDEITHLRGEGHDPQLLLELAAQRGWLTVYAKDDRTKKSRAASGLDGERTADGRRIVGGFVAR